MTTHRISLALIVVSGFLFAQCSKNNTAPEQAGGKAVVDTTQKAEPVKIEDANHHIYFHPVVGTVGRYHIMDRMMRTFTDQTPDGKSNKQSIVSVTDFYLRQTVKSVGKDSVVELTYRVDSIELKSQRDTSVVHYSSGNAVDRKDDRFHEFNLILGKEFSIKTNKYGDPDSITDTKAVENALLASAPDTIRTKPQVKTQAKQLAKELIGQVINTYVMHILAHSPTRALVKDTTWHNVSEVNLEVARGLSFPVVVDASETVHGLEKRGDKVLAVLEDHTSSSPKQTVIDEGEAKATVNNFSATSKSIMRIEDATGLLVHRSTEEKRSFTFQIESKQHPAEKRLISQDGSETMTAELIE